MSEKIIHVWLNEDGKVINAFDKEQLNTRPFVEASALTDLRSELETESIRRNLAVEMASKFEAQLEAYEKTLVVFDSALALCEMIDPKKLDGLHTLTPGAAREARRLLRGRHPEIKPKLSPLWKEGE